MKVALEQTNPAWVKLKLGEVVCVQCSWRGDFSKLLAERDNRILFCPKCTSSQWAYVFDKK